eukprot:567298-Amphidinium_carterae.1
MGRWWPVSDVEPTPSDIGLQSCELVAPAVGPQSVSSMVCIRNLLVRQPPCLVSELLQRTLHGGGKGGCWLNWG